MPFHWWVFIFTIFSLSPPISSFTTISSFIPSACSSLNIKLIPKRKKRNDVVIFSSLFLYQKLSLGHLWRVWNFVCTYTLTVLSLYPKEWPPKPFALADSFSWGWNLFLRIADLVPCLSDNFYIIPNFYAFALVYFIYKLIWTYLVLLIYYWYCFVILLINLSNLTHYLSNINVCVCVCEEKGKKTYMWTKNGEFFFFFFLINKYTHKRDRKKLTSM